MKTRAKLLALILLVPFSIMRSQPSGSGHPVLQHPVSVEDLSSMNDGKHYTVLETGSKIVKYSYATGMQTEALFDLSAIPDAPYDVIDEYAFSPDETKILLTMNKQMIYRRSYTAEYYVWDMQEGLLKPLSDGGRQQLAEFSPDNLRIAFVRNNNLFIKDLQAGEELQITRDGKYNHIINGAPDWVYEEEFGFNKAYAWSPDGEKIAWLRFDEAHVRLYNMTTYGGLYPEWYQFKYPKAGEENSHVTLHVYRLGDGQVVDIDVGEETDQYIPRIEWTADPDQLAFIRLNRLQNKLDLFLTDASSGNTRLVMTETEEQYISEPTDDKVTFLDDGKHFILMSEQSGFMHFYLYDLEGNLVNPVTSGEWDVSEYLGYDRESERIYYSSHEESSINRSVYSIHISGKKKKKISRRKGWNTAKFSKGFRYFIHYHSSTTTPRIVTLHKAGGKQVRELQNNEFLKNRADAKGLGRKEFMTIETDSGIKLNAYMVKPVDFDPDKQYPLFIFVYGGPESQNVKDAWGYESWYMELVSQGYIVACIDNRGTNGRGEAFRKSTYLNLGKLETIDQIESARYLANLNYIDRSRIGIYGWSYGGYMTSLCMTKGEGLFRMGIAVAPVTNWKYYDTIYTERFMRTPQENQDGYEDNSPVNFAGQLQGSFLLVHGMSDDNVHFQNSVDFAQALIEAGKQFEMLYYPNRNHGIRGGNSRPHLYTKMLDFVLENL